jgi:hypothetical protein
MQDRVFGRLTQTAMQLGGFVKFEHTSLRGEGLSETADTENEPADTVPSAAAAHQELMSYAGTCAQFSAHVWLLFVFDESAASSDLPATVSR